MNLQEEALKARSLDLHAHDEKPFFSMWQGFKLVIWSRDPRTERSCIKALDKFIAKIQKLGRYARH